MCKPKTPTVPATPPPRAMERLPSRGMVAADARRQVEATYGARNAPATILGSPARSALGPGTGALRGSSSANTVAMSTILGG